MQGLPSSGQLLGAPAMHSPLTQASSTVHGSSSSHDPATGTFLQPAPEKQVSAVQTSPSSQEIG